MHENDTADAILSGLNPQQAQAATSPFDTHCLVLAGAGCGKTAVLTRRIALCAVTFCEQKRILALTFTRKAAEEMKTRLLALPGIHPDRELPTVTTFHGFGLSILRGTVAGRRNSERLGYSSEPALLSDEKRLEALASISSKGERAALGLDLLKLDDLIACASVDPRKTHGLGSQKRAVLDMLVGRFAGFKTANNVWEFSDMIARSLELLSNFADVRRHYAALFRHIVVDEFQDTNPLQISALKQLLSEGTKAFAVGDDDQAIYGFRGADTEPTLNFAHHFPGARLVKLETNYRSRPSILCAANRIFADKPPQYRKVLRSGKYASTPHERGPKPRRRVFATQHDMVAWIVQTMRRIHASHDVPVERMCMLFRLNETLEWSREELRALLGGDEAVPKMMTVHGAKGLEFPVVFLCDLEESVFPSYRLHRSRRIRGWGDVLKKMLTRRRQGGDGENLDEEKRLFYVGVTRAEHRLFLLSCRSKQVLGRSARFEPSRFVRLVR